MDDIISTALWAALHSGGGSANLDSVTFTENDTYTPVAPLDGWDEVTVNVPTYEDEYRDALERIAELEKEVDDLEEQVEECDQCKADVIAKLQEYDPNFDPQTCEDIPDEVDKVAGYEFPPDVPYDPTILDAVGGDPITDVQTGQTLYCAFHTQAESIGGMQGAEAWYTDSAGNVYLINGDYDGDPTVYYTNCRISMVDSTTGTVRLRWSKRTTQDPSWGYDSDFTQTVSDLIGYGATGHTYKVHNT